MVEDILAHLPSAVERLQSLKKVSSPGGSSADAVFLQKIETRKAQIRRLLIKAVYM